MLLAGAKLKSFAVQITLEFIGKKINLNLQCQRCKCLVNLLSLVFLGFLSPRKDHALFNLIFLAYHGQFITSEQLGCLPQKAAICSPLIL